MRHKRLTATIPLLAVGIAFSVRGDPTSSIGRARLKTAERSRNWTRSLFLSVAAIGIVATAILTVSQAHAANIAGQVLDGSTPICNATVTLYQAGSRDYGAGATNCGTATSDSNGNFSIAPACSPPASAQIYLVATGGGLNTGDCASTSAMIVLETALGPFSLVGSQSSYVIDELTTVASVWSLAQFLNPADPTDAGGPSSNTLGLRNAAVGVRQSRPAESLHRRDYHRPNHPGHSSANLNRVRHANDGFEDEERNRHQPVRIFIAAQ